MGSDDLYRILEVSRGASADEIKKSYRELARKLHPDKNPSEAAAAKFKKVSAAFAVLGDAKKRALYDEFGPDGLREGFDPNAARHFHNFGGGFGGMGGGLGGFGDLEELLGGLFGGGRVRQQRPRKGRDVKVAAPLSLSEMLQGTELNLASGGGRVKVPAGVYDGQKMRLSGRGEAGPAGPGDLLIELKVHLPAGLERAGNDLTRELPIKISDAVLGSTHEIELPDGETLTVRVPAGSQTGQRLRLKSRGLPFKGGRGHLYLCLKVMMPTLEGPELEEMVKGLDAFYSNA
ncbi:MAG: DnaJ C-terminal domain-containing protein [Bradymonadia bacterium]